MTNVEHPGRAEAVKAHFERLFKEYGGLDIEAEITAALSADIDEAPMEKVEVKPFTIHLPGIVKAERPRVFTASEQPSVDLGES